MGEVNNCRACGLLFEQEIDEDGTYTILKWRQGNLSTGGTTPKAPRDLYEAWVCKRCYKTGPALEELIRYLDKELAEQSSIPQKVIEQPVIPVIIPPAIKPSQDYWTRPISSLYKNKERFR